MKTTTDELLLGKLFAEGDEGELSVMPAKLSLAMAYVPFQQWEKPYEPEVALKRGTIFPGLDKPFIGEEAAKDADTQ